MPDNDTVKDAIIDELLKTGTRAMQFGMEQHVPPAVLYHFTNSNGLVGILRSKSLWASHALSLNDASEVSYGVSLTMEYLQGRASNEPGPLRRAFLELALEWLKNTDVESDTTITVDHFVVSFCADISRSSHWLHYGRGGHGYVIGLHSDRLVRPPFDLAKVIYEPDAQQVVIDGAIRQIEEKFLDLAMQHDWDIKARVGSVAAHLCATSIRALTARLKHPSFADEHEWRLVTMSLNGKRIPEGHGISLGHGYRTTGSRIVPYLVAEYPDGLPVSEIVLGYAVESKQAGEALRLLFKQEKVEPAPEVRVSAVPVRSDCS